MQLKDLKPSIYDLPVSEGFKLIEEVRVRRKEVKSNKAPKKAKAKPASLAQGVLDLGGTVKKPKVPKKSGVSRELMLEMLRKSLS